MKKIAAILTVMLFLWGCVALNVNANDADAIVTLKDEKALFNKITSNINDYVKSVDWTKRKNYQPEVDNIAKIIEGYGYKEEDYLIELLIRPDKLPVVLKMFILGKVDPEKKSRWSAAWLVQKKKPKIAPPEVKKKKGPPEYIPWGPFDQKGRKYKI
jgi:hypothetical protein